jgi:hypothetical protein
MIAWKRQWIVWTFIAALLCGDMAWAQGGGAGNRDVIRLAAVADVWLADGSPRERNFSTGKMPQLKLRNSQDLALVRFDTSGLQGREVLEAALFLHRANADKLRYVRISTVNQDWEEGESVKPSGPPSGATFLLADATAGVNRGWAWSGSSVADVIMSSGNSLGCWGERRELDDGWISVPLTPELVYALGVGDTDGLAVMDGGTPANHDNYISSVETGNYAPYIEVRLGRPLATAPAAPVVRAEPAPERAHLRSGAIQMTIEPADDVFCWRVRMNGCSVARWRVHRPERRKPTTFFLEDLQPGRDQNIEIVAVSPGGQASLPTRLAVRSSKALPRDTALGAIEPLRAVEAGPMEDAGVRVWALPGLVKIHPVSGAVMTGDLGVDVPQNVRPEHLANPVWNGRQVGLFGARGECVSFQICIENLKQEPLDPVELRPEPLEGANGARIAAQEIELSRNWYARNRLGHWQPAYCVPLAHQTAFTIPFSQDRLTEQRNQTIYVDIAIPKNAGPGTYSGAIVVAANHEAEIRLPITLEVLNLTIPHRLAFWPELNAFQIPDHAVDYYRLAHQHRCVLNCWAWRPKLTGSGRNVRVDWEQYDRCVGPLLTGEAFADGRRAGVPVECMYLPFDDNWPTPLTKQTYRYEGYWPGKGDDPARIIDHYLTAPPIGQAISQEYKDAFLSVQRQFIEHFQEKGYTHTEMQCFFGTKVAHRIEYGLNTWWTTDEPYYWNDWLALQYFTHLWAAGRGSADPRVWTARADIARPQWQGRTLAGLVDAGYYGAGGFSGPAMVRRCRNLAQEAGVNVRTYGAASHDSVSNTETVTVLLSAWADGADAFLPWQSLGSGESLDENDAGAAGGNALLVPGDRMGVPVVADLRLKALRDGQQLIEYLTLLAERRRWSREQIKAMIHEATRSSAQVRRSPGIDDADAIVFDSLSAWQIAQLRRRVADLLR